THPRPATRAADRGAAGGDGAAAGRRPGGRGHLDARAAAVRDPEPARDRPASGPEWIRGDRGGRRARRGGDRPVARLGRRARRDGGRRGRLPAEPRRRPRQGGASDRDRPGARQVHARERRDGLRGGRDADAPRAEAGLGRAQRRVADPPARRGRRAAGGAGRGPAGGDAMTKGKRRTLMPKLRLRSVALAALAALVGGCETAPLTAPDGSTIILQANPTFVISNGGTSVVTAVVVEPAGTFVPDGTEVTFLSNLGRIDQVGKTVNGLARVNFVSDARSGTATITAISGQATVARPAVVPARHGLRRAGQPGAERAGLVLGDRLDGEAGERWRLPLHGLERPGHRHAANERPGREHGHRYRHGDHGERHQRNDDGRLRPDLMRLALLGVVASLAL